MTLGADRFDCRPGLREVPDEIILMVKGHDVVALLDETEPLGVEISERRVEYGLQTFVFGSHFVYLSSLLLLFVFRSISSSPSPISQFSFRAVLYSLLM